MRTALLPYLRRSISSLCSHVKEKGVSAPAISRDLIQLTSPSWTAGPVLWWHLPPIKWTASCSSAPHGWDFLPPPGVPSAWSPGGGVAARETFTEVTKLTKMGQQHQPITNETALPHKYLRFFPLQAHIDKISQTLSSPKPSVN